MFIGGLIKKCNDKFTKRTYISFEVLNNLFKYVLTYITIAYVYINILLLKKLNLSNPIPHSLKISHYLSILHIFYN